jgi:hypothetical protein
MLFKSRPICHWLVAWLQLQVLWVYIALTGGSFIRIFNRFCASTGAIGTAGMGGILFCGEIVLPMPLNKYHRRALH